MTKRTTRQTLRQLKSKKARKLARRRRLHKLGTAAATTTLLTASMKVPIIVLAKKVSADDSVATEQMVEISAAELQDIIFPEETNQERSETPEVSEPTEPLTTETQAEETIPETPLSPTPTVPQDQIQPQSSNLQTLNQAAGILAAPIAPTSLETGLFGSASYDYDTDTGSLPSQVLASYYQEVLQVHGSVRCAMRWTLTTSPSIQGFRKLLLKPSSKPMFTNISMQEKQSLKLISQKF